MNLIENAVKYAETKGSSGGKVDVKAHTREGYDVSAYVRSKSGQGVSLRQPISRYSSVDLEDVYNVKKALMSEGYYEPNPKLGLNEFTDEALFDGIKKFQKDNGLRVDGIMKPGGETESKINEIKNSNTWGDKTKVELDKYIDAYNSYPGKTRTGIVAPYKDMKRNFDDMNKLELIGSDRFFYCKANYEAAKRGALGKATATIMSAVKESKDIFKYGLEDTKRDWNANKRGWDGAKSGRSLAETCPTHPKKYK